MQWGVGDVCNWVEHVGHAQVTTWLFLVCPNKELAFVSRSIPNELPNQDQGTNVFVANLLGSRAYKVVLHHTWISVDPKFWRYNSCTTVLKVANTAARSFQMYDIST
jgi:hypothetical protein